ncbi:hypothetical protein D915_000076 [Fasciola hepatica]|uniref:Uncharacterized protein n=1 Tax=Fasciola hepatica TaxID=6192 RepID=A0A4E0RPW2_FASHE|nr:hypothetical protein D915_000076 [Fasciola hepatica]
MIDLMSEHTHVYMSPLFCQFFRTIGQETKFYSTLVCVLFSLIRHGMRPVIDQVQMSSFSEREFRRIGDPGRSFVCCESCCSMSCLLPSLFAVFPIQSSLYPSVDRTPHSIPNASTLKQANKKGADKRYPLLIVPLMQVALAVNFLN